MNKKKPDEIHLAILGYKTFTDEKYADEFFQILKEADDRYVPLKVGDGEPLRIPFNMENARKAWMETNKRMPGYGGPMFRGRSMDEYYGDIIWRPDESNIISFWMEREFMKANSGVARFIELAKKLFLWSNAVYGYACHSSNLPDSCHFQECLGGITWMTLFGPPYVEMFGRDTILTAPCIVEEFAENRFILLTSEEPQEKNAQILKTQKKVKKHLGKDAFYREDIFARHTFTLEELKAGIDQPNKKKKYRAPDFSSYLKPIPTDFKKPEGIIYEVKDDGSVEIHEIKQGKGK